MTRLKEETGAESVAMVDSQETGDVMKIIFRFDVGVFLVILLLRSIEVNASTITCGMKTVTLNGNEITQIAHEDGTIHSGGSISTNWTYTDNSIKHRLMDSPIPCGTASKTRDEIISELSGMFTKDPKSFGMSMREAKLMEVFTAKLMRNDTTCYLLIDAQKSTNKPGMFFIDCNDAQAKRKRFWVSLGDLERE